MEQLVLLTDPQYAPEAKDRRSGQRQVKKILEQMHALSEQLNRALYGAKASERPVINSPSDAYNILFDMSHLEKEELRAILLNTRNRVMRIVPVYRGSLNSTQVRVGELFREAILENAAAILIAHNHPSGDPDPSPDDVGLTSAVVQAGELLDINVLDHLVVGAGRYVSLKERGLGFK